MLLLDVNVVIAAHRVDHAQHAIAHSWFDDVLVGSDRFSVPAVVWASFIRLVTNRRILARPTPRDDAFEFLDAVCAQPNYVMLTQGPQHLELLRRVCEEADATGDLVPDAVLAALALEHGCSVASFDRDFARFPSIEHIIPGVP